MSVTLVGEKHRHLMKEVVKRAKENVKARTISSSVVNEMRSNIEKVEEEVVDIKKLEAEEKNLRIAEMEANKIRNMMDYEEDIQSRPRRTWFQTKTEKKEHSLLGKPKTEEEIKKEEEEQKNKYGQLKRRGDRSTFSKFGVIGAEDGEKKRPHRLSRKKRRRLEAEMSIAKEERRERREAKYRGEDPEEVITFKDKVKAAESKQHASARHQKRSKREGGQLNSEKLKDKKKEAKKKAKTAAKEERRNLAKKKSSGVGDGAFGSEMTYASTKKFKRDVFAKKSSVKQVGAGSRKEKGTKGQGSSAFQFDGEKAKPSGKRKGAKPTAKFKSAAKFNRSKKRR